LKAIPGYFKSSELIKKDIKDLTRFVEWASQIKRDVLYKITLRNNRFCMGYIIRVHFRSFQCKIVVSSNFLSVERRYRSLLILTDGCAAAPTKPPATRVVWVLPEGCEPPPIIRNLKYYDIEDVQPIEVKDLPLYINAEYYKSSLFTDLLKE
jgi:hypothetical protein